jgi:hypothetical protein
MFPSRSSKGWVPRARGRALSPRLPTRGRSLLEAGHSRGRLGLHEALELADRNPRWGWNPGLSPGGDKGSSRSSARMSSPPGPTPFWLLAARRRAGQTQVEFAARVGVDPRTILNIERGLRPPHGLTLKKWESVLGERVTLTAVRRCRSRSCILGSPIRAGTPSGLPILLCTELKPCVSALGGGAGVSSGHPDC